MFTVAGVIKESPEYRNESLLLGETAGEMHNIGRRLCGAGPHENGDPARTRPLSADEAAQRELHLQEEEDEVRQAAATLEDRSPTVGSGRSRSSSEDSHRRRRMLAQHHKDHLRGDKSREDDDHSLIMAMSSSTSQASELGNRTGAEDGEDELPKHDPLALNLVQLERRRGETPRDLLSYLDWLRSHREHWRTLQVWWRNYRQRR